MPLKYSDGSCLSDIGDLETYIYAKFEDSSKLLHSMPVQQCPPHKGLLYVGQREFAVTTVIDEVIDTLGSDDATTCHIAVLRHSGNGVTGLCHFDGCNTSQGVQDLVDRVLTLSQDAVEGRLELHVVGGFKDDRRVSEDLSRELLGEFHKLSVDVYLLTACISGLNNTVKGGIDFPIIYGIAVSVKTGAIFPALFDSKGPDQALRSLRHFISDRDIGPYSYTDFPNAALWLQQSDSTIRQYLSTSPAVEPEHFVQGVREAISFYLSNPVSESVFPGGLPHVFTMKQDGYWQAVVL